MTITAMTILTTTGTIIMLDDFLVRAALAGVGLALATGPLGAFVVWRRMAYFGDATAHAAILGVALALATSLPITLGTLAVALAMALTVAGLAARGWAMDTVLGVLAHSALAFGLVAISFFPAVRNDLSSYLFGDILAVSKADLLLVYAGGATVLAVVAWLWRPLLAATVSPELAEAEGLRPERSLIAFMLLMAAVVAIAMKIVGVLLITALLIVPAATARRFASTPETMAVLASLIGAASIVAGLFGSFRFDTPSGPSIVVAALAIFIVTLVPTPGRTPAR